jgi:hypothetical protein
VARVARVAREVRAERAAREARAADGRANGTGVTCPRSRISDDYWMGCNKTKNLQVYRLIVAQLALGKNKDPRYM